MTVSVDERRYIVKRLFAGAGFRTVSYSLARLCQVVRVMVFARLFTPSDIGTASLTLSCISLVSVLGNFGFSLSVIRRRDNSSEFSNTAFSLSLIVGIVLLLLTLAGAPVFSRVFATKLDTYIWFLAFTVLAVPLQFPVVFWEKELRFGHPSVAYLIPEFVSLMVSVAIEVKFHLGIWSLLVGHASGFLLSGLYIWLAAESRPRLQIERTFVKPLLSFGAPIMVQGVNGEVMARGDNLIVGACSGTSQLAYYNFAWQLPMMISSLTSTIDTMLYPVYARLNDSRESMMRLFNLTNKMWSIMGSVLGFPIILFADRIVYFLYGPKWEPVVPILQVMTVSFVIRFCTGYGYDNLVLVRGRTKYMMKWGFVNTLLVFTLGLFMIRRMGPIGGAWFWVVQALTLTPLIRFPLIYQELGSLAVLRHIWQPVLSGLVAVSCSYGLIRSVFWTDPAKLAVSIAGFIVPYLGMLIILDRQLVADVKKILLVLRQQNG